MNRYDKQLSKHELTNWKKIICFQESNSIYHNSIIDKPEVDDFRFDSENEELFAIGINQKKRKKREKTKSKGGPDLKKQKLTHRQKINVMKILSPEFYDLKGKIPNYMTMRSSPSVYPAHKYCSVCGFTYKYKCPRCGMAYCSTNCFKIHRETVCIRFGS